MAKSLPLEDIIERTLAMYPEDVRPLIKYLQMDGVRLSKKQKRKETALKISDYLREMGSNDIATYFRGEGVSYDEVVYDVGKRLKASVTEGAKVEKNEELILEKIFADALDHMTDDEKRQVFSDIGIDAKDIPWKKAGMAAAQVFMNQFGGFAVYRLSVIVANMVARALLGQGLSFTANAALVQAVGAFIGPIGWLATGAWLLIDMAGPAFRKTVPAVIHVAMLRQMLLNRVTIGIVGDGSSGKDSMIKAVFGIDTGNIDPVAGSTKEAKVYELGLSGAVRLVNYPGFNDVRPDVNQHTSDFLHHTDVFVMVVDISRGISAVETSILERLETFERPILICLNKIDLPRPGELEKLVKIAKERLKVRHYILAAFDPDPRLAKSGPLGCDEVHKWICEQLRKADKETSHIPKSEYAA